VTAKQRRVVVTGAGSGLGWAIAHRFEGLGDRVLAVDQYGDRLEKFAVQHPGVDTVTADVGTSEGADAVFAAVGDRLDVLCNNAGILDRLALIDEADDALFDQVIATNLRGPFTLAHRAVPLMLAAGRGCIVNVASVAGLRGGRAGAAYTTSKFGLVGLTYNIAATVRGQGIRCNAVCPGGMVTQIGVDQEVGQRGIDLMSANARVPACDPDLVAKIVVFLASAEAEHINGVALPVDGGTIAS
jgi:NAD(P)-dependent dehydrogenase (short-subunit alcohol dehydrogenase family)